MKNKNFSITEYGVISKASDFPNAKSDISRLYLSDDNFKSVYNFVLSTQAEIGDGPFSLYSKGKNLFIKVRNYVGIIETKDGVTIELLPKVCNGVSEQDLLFTRMVFIKMFSALADVPFLNIKTAHLSAIKKLPVLEIFIKTYIEEAKKILNEGLRARYAVKHENLNFLKGKLLQTENLKHNSFNHSKFYCEFSELSENNAQNRILKTTLLKLIKITSSYANYSQLSKLLLLMENIHPSGSVVGDLKKCSVKNRLFKSYESLLKWSEIFLQEKSFTNFKGGTYNLAILFPMERVFENYITKIFKKYSKGNFIHAQDMRHYLVERHQNKGIFRLKPDIYIVRQGARHIIADTKWIMIDETTSSKNYNINMANIYQLFAYGKKYSQNGINPILVIICPQNSLFTKKLDTFLYEEGLALEIFPFDFRKNEKVQIEEILNLE